MKDLYLENERLKEVISRGSRRIKFLTERIKELEKAKNEGTKFSVDIPEEVYNSKCDAIKKHCIYQKHFCDGTPNSSQIRNEDRLPICPKYNICALRKNRIIPKLDKN